MSDSQRLGGRAESSIARDGVRGHGYANPDTLPDCGVHCHSCTDWFFELAEGISSYEGKGGNWGWGAGGGWIAHDGVMVFQLWGEEEAGRRGLLR